MASAKAGASLLRYSERPDWLPRCESHPLRFVLVFVVCAVVAQCAVGVRALLPLFGALAPTLASAPSSVLCASLHRRWTE
eukprot:4289087-Prymnesium_polylepis.2